MDIFKEPVKARMDCSDFIPINEYLWYEDLWYEDV